MPIFLGFIWMSIFSLWDTIPIHTQYSPVSWESHPGSRQQPGDQEYAALHQAPWLQVISSGSWFYDFYVIYYLRSTSMPWLGLPLLT